LSGNNRHATATSTARPSLVSAEINGLDVARFNGTSNALSVARPFDGTGSMWHVQKTATANYFLFFSGNNTKLTLAVESGSSSGVAPGFGTPDWYRDGNVQTWSPRGDAYTALNSRTAVVGAVGASMSGWSTPIGMWSGSGYFFAGDIGEIIAISGEVSEETRRLIEGYLCWKWGLENNLPSDHVYKGSPPGEDTYGFSGVVTNADGDPDERTVRVYLDSNGALIGATQSNATTGAWSFSPVSNAAHSIVASGESGKSSLILSDVMPVIVE
jgi:hypothetical protein